MEDVDAFLLCLPRAAIHVEDSKAIEFQNYAHTYIHMDTKTDKV